MSADPPPPTVMHAFRVGDELRPLAGGQGTSWLAGDVVLKPHAGPVHEGLAPVLAGLAAKGVRVARPVPTRDGAWTHQGWSATRWVEGGEPDRSSDSAWIAIIDAGRAFHRAVAEVARPAWLGARTDPWAQADRAAWGEQPVRWRRELIEVARRLHGGLEPLGGPQLVHGDLAGNVLFAAGKEPAIIDFSPYWRPSEYAEGVVLADALCWHSASVSLLEETRVSVAAVARGLLFRMATTNLRAPSGPGDANLRDEGRRYATAAAAIGL